MHWTKNKNSASQWITIGKKSFRNEQLQSNLQRLRCVSCDLRECVCVNVNLFVRYFYTRRRRNIYFNTHGGELTTLIFYLSIFVTITKDSKSEVFNYINVARAPKLINRNALIVYVNQCVNTYWVHCAILMNTCKMKFHHRHELVCACAVRSVWVLCLFGQFKKWRHLRMQERDKNNRK